MNKEKLTPEQYRAKKEAGQIVKDLEKVKCSLPDKEKNILKWSMPELKAYILSETSGMSNKKKLKFSHQVMKRIIEEKKRIGLK